MCYNAVDRHVESGRGEQPAVIYDSPVTGTKQIITFRELQDQVCCIIKDRNHKTEEHRKQDQTLLFFLKPDLKC